MTFCAEKNYFLYFYPEKDFYIDIFVYNFIFRKGKIFFNFHINYWKREFINEFLKEYEKLYLLKEEERIEKLRKKALFGISMEIKTEANKVKIYNFLSKLLPSKLAFKITKNFLESYYENLPTIKEKIREEIWK